MLVEGDSVSMLFREIWWCMLIEGYSVSMLVEENGVNILVDGVSMSVEDRAGVLVEGDSVAVC